MANLLSIQDEYLFERIQDNTNQLGYEFNDYNNYMKFTKLLGNTNLKEDSKFDLNLHEPKSFNKSYIKDLNEFRVVTNNIEKLFIEHNKFIELQEQNNDLDKTKLEELKDNFKQVREVVEKETLDFKQGFKGIKNSLQNEVKEFDKKIKILEKEIKNFEKNKTKKSNYQEINLHSQNAIFRRQALIEDLKFDKESLQDSYDRNFIERNSDLLIKYTKGINKSFKENLGFEPLAKNYTTRIDLLNKTIEIKDMKFVYDSFKKGLHSKTIDQMEKIRDDFHKNPTMIEILISKNVSELEAWRFKNPNALEISNEVKDKIFIKTSKRFIDRDKAREEALKIIENYKTNNNGIITDRKETSIYIKVINKHLNKVKEDNKEIIEVLQKIEKDSLKKFEELDAIRSNIREKQKLEKELNEEKLYKVVKDSFKEGLEGATTNLEKLNYIANSKKVFKDLNLVGSSNRKEFYKELESLETSIKQSIKQELEQEKILEKSKTLTKDFIEKLDKSKSNEELEAIYKEINSKFEELDKESTITLFNKYFEKQTSLREEPKVELKVEEPKVELKVEESKVVEESKFDTKINDYINSLKGKNLPKIEELKTNFKINDYIDSLKGKELSKIEEPKVEEIKDSQIALDNEQLARKNFKIIVNNKKYDNELKVNKLGFHLEKITRLKELARRENILRMYKERIEALKVDIDLEKAKAPKVEPKVTKTNNLETKELLEKGKQQEMKLDSKPKIEEPEVEPKVIEPKVEPKVEEPKVEDTNNVEDEDGFGDFDR